MIYIKYLYFIIILNTANSYGMQLDTCKLNIDSVFHTHFLSLDTTIKYDTPELVAFNDFEFVYLIGYISGIRYHIHSYSGHPMLTIKDVLDYKGWYEKNKSKIKCETIYKGMHLLKKGVLTDDDIDELEKLKID